MGVAYHTYRVNLAHWQQAVGSKDQELYQKALKYLEDTWFGLIQRQEVAIERPLYVEHLERIIFEGQVSSEIISAERLNQFVKNYREKYRLDYDLLMLELDEDSADDLDILDLELGRLSLAISAIFSTDASFFRYGWRNAWRYYSLYEDLKTNVGLDAQAQQLWKYFLEGRSLGGEFPSLLNYERHLHTFFKNAELKDMLGSLEYYRTAAGIKHLAEVAQSPKAGEFEDLWGVFENSLRDSYEQGLDFYAERG